MIPLFKELEYAKSYLIIQKMRYKDKLEFSVESDPGLKQERVFESSFTAHGGECHLSWH